MRYFSSISSSSLGNILEWYDFGLFIIFSSLFSRLFFPSSNTYAATLATFSIFAIGFICRPIGALIFGYLGDKNGRAKTLRLSILMISLPTLLIGILPTYQQIGILAPILLTLTRIWQGISIGGEYSGNLIYLAETAPSKHRAFITSFACIGANLGILLAALVGIITTKSFTELTLDAWGWRIPYLISGLFCIVIYRFRLKLHESIAFEYLKTQHKTTAHPIHIAFTRNYLDIIRTIGMVCMGSAFYYFSFIYLPVFLKQSMTYSLGYISFIVTFYIMLMLLLVPAAGWLCDRLGRRKMLLFNALFISLITVPGFYLLQHTSMLSFVILILFFFTCASSLEQGTTSIAVVENFPTPARYTGLSLGYNLANGFLGGTVPIVCEWLNARYSLGPAIYITLYAMITFVTVFYFVPETRHRQIYN